jgi:hypothetical protein
LECCVQNTKGLAIFIKETAVAKKTKKLLQYWAHPTVRPLDEYMRTPWAYLGFYEDDLVVCTRERELSART